jgi:hypothetical protein
MQKSHKLHPYGMEKADLSLIADKFDFAFKEWKYEMPGNVIIQDA